MSKSDKENDAGASSGPTGEAGVNLAGFMEGGVHTLKRPFVEQHWERLLFEYLLVSLGMDRALAEVRHEEIYDDTTGVVVNKLLRQAFDYYQQAAASGNAHAQFCAGLLHEDLGDVYDNSDEYWGEEFSLDINYDKKMAISLYEQAAAQGHTEAPFRLGLLYTHDQIVPKNPEQAFAWLYAAAKDGHRHAAFMLGDRYLRGNGVPQDFSKAYFWLKQAAEQGSKLACSALSLMYRDGVGVARDAVLRDFWDKKYALADIDE